MRSIGLSVLLLAAAAPALAIDQGQCCAKVHNVCISTCSKPGGCTGQGDCTLALTSAAGKDLDPASPAFKRALRTLPRSDQQRLRRLVAPAKPPQGSRPPDPVEPIQLAQLGGTTAMVPMKHGSCGLDCNTHVLALASGNLDVSFNVGMTCPPGLVVNQVWVQPQGQNVTKLVDAATREAGFSQTIKLQPFSKQELEAACQAALGGGWPVPGSHKNTEKTVKKTIKESVQVWGRCSTWANSTMRSYPVAVTLTCEDQSFIVPEP